MMHRLNDGVRYRLHHRHILRLFGSVALGALSLPLGAQAQTLSEITTLPDINVIATSPASRPSQKPPARPVRAPAPPTRTAQQPPATTATGTEGTPNGENVGANANAGTIDRDKVPSNTTVLTPADFDHTRSPSLLDSLVTAIPGVSLGDQSGNAFQRDLNYRGFVASPVPGTPQGIAVYQNGVRINEAYGDIVNWDFIPEMAINKLTMVPSNPIFGLNAIGGAMTIDMKDGFSYQGKEVELMGGSYGRRTAAVQAGVQEGNLSGYATFDATNDNGWRQFSSASQLRRMYIDLGARNDQTEFHINLTAADDQLGAVAATPVQMLNQNWASVYTWPQTTHLQLAFLTSSLSYAPTDWLTLQGNSYYRGFWQAHVDGNGTDAMPCGPAPTTFCIDGGPLNITNPNLPDNLPPGAFLGEIDRNWTATNSFGGTAQATSTAKIVDHDNHLTFGVSLDHGHTQFHGDSELGTINSNLFVQGQGIYIDQPLADITPVHLLALNTYTGFFATDTFDVTSRFSVTAGARFNVAQINLMDETGTDALLNGSNHYERLNPVIGATYKITPNVTAYAGYSEANRAPTPLELGCSSPTVPCMIDNFLIADPPLKQVVSRTYEGGLRGTLGTSDKTGQLSWGIGAFHTTLTDDIINVASTVPLFGYFQNIQKDLRQGIEAKVNYRRDRLNLYSNFTWVDATYETTVLISSPNNPFANPVTGDILVTPGDHIPAVPDYRFKAGAEYNITDAWKFGADLNAVGSQYLIHDDSNQNPKVPAYWVVNLHSSYKYNEHVEFFGLINNVFNQHYYAAGTFAQVNGAAGIFNSNTFGAPGFLDLTDPRTFLPGIPFVAYGGMRVTF
jgi:iron complex outermembrane recepter protein